MEIALVSCASWLEGEIPLTLATLQANLKKEGYKTYIFDINNHYYNDHKSLFFSLKTLNLLGYILRSKFPKFFSGLINIIDYPSKKKAQEILSKGVKAVCFSSNTTNFLTSLNLAKKIKKQKPEVKIICGGPASHFGFIRKFLSKSGAIDNIISFESDIILPEILKKKTDKIEVASSKK